MKKDNHKGKENQEKNKEVYKFGQGVKQKSLEDWLPFLCRVYEIRVNEG